MTGQSALAACEARIRGVKARIKTPQDPNKFCGLDERMGDYRYLEYLEGLRRSILTPSA